MEIVFAASFLSVIVVPLHGSGYPNCAEKMGAQNSHQNKWWDNFARSTVRLANSRGLVYYIVIQ